MVFSGDRKEYVEKTNPICRLVKERKIQASVNIQRAEAKKQTNKQTSKQTNKNQTNKQKYNLITHI